LTSPTSTDRKVVRFVGRAAEEDFKNLPDEVHRTATTLLGVLQSGNIPKGKDRYKSLKNKLSGIDEIRIDGEDGNTYRIYDIISYPEIVYVLDARAKKSTEGGNIPKADEVRLLARKKAADADYKTNEAIYKRDFAVRAQRRAALEALRKPKPKGT
jgi:phage-related protein